MSLSRQVPPDAATLGCTPTPTDAHSTYRKRVRTPILPRRQLFLVPHPPRRWAPDADAVPATVAPGVDAASLTELAFQSRPVSEPNLVPEDTDAADTGASNAGQVCA